MDDELSTEELWHCIMKIINDRRPDDVYGYMFTEVIIREEESVWQRIKKCLCSSWKSCVN